jgi:excisionase family DNA binding protein
MPTPDGWLTGGEAAELLGNVSAKTVWRWANEGKLACVRTLGGHTRYNPDMIAALARSLRIVPTVPAVKQAADWHTTRSRTADGKFLPTDGATP